MYRCVCTSLWALRKYWPVSLARLASSSSSSPFLKHRVYSSRAYGKTALPQVEDYIVRECVCVGLLISPGGLEVEKTLTADNENV